MLRVGRFLGPPSCAPSTLTFLQRRREVLWSQLTLLRSLDGWREKGGVSMD